MNNLNLKPVRAVVLGYSFLLFFALACKEAKKTDPAEESMTEAAIEEEIMEETDTGPLVVNEHHFSDVPLTTHPSAPKKTPEGGDLAADIPSKDMGDVAKVDPMDYEVHTTDVLHESLGEMEYEVEEEITVQEAIIPLDETQTLVSYNKKGKYKDSLQVISEADGTIDQIIFTHKKHKDVYDVQAGMSAKEVKKLRKELKHMVKKGQVFLYSDTSNIMYLLDVQNAEGDEIMEADIETMTVEAIIWKDKKDKKS